MKDEICFNSGSWLFLDTALPRLQVGLLNNGEWSSCEVIVGPVLENLFMAIKRCFQKSGFCVEELTGVVLSQGPGSNIGVRAACAFVRTLICLPFSQHLQFFTYNTLHFSQVYLSIIQEETSPFYLFAKANLTHLYGLLAEESYILGKIEKKLLMEVPESLRENAWWLPSQTQPAYSTKTVHYLLKESLPILLGSITGLFQKNTSPDIFILT